MIWIIYVVIAVVVAYVVLRVFAQLRGGAAAVARFELSADSDKESFTDPKTGKRYDKQGYDAYLKHTVQNMTDQQLNSLLTQYGGRDNIWNEKMCEAIRAEQARRREAAEAAEAESEEAAEEINEEIAPFFWVEQSTGASVGLSCGEYLQEQFERHGMDGNGSDWDRLAKAFLKTKTDLRGKIRFDSQQDLFCVYSRDAAAVKTFIYGFRAACETESEREELFGRLTEE